MRKLRERFMPTLSESRTLLGLALPVIIVQVGMMAMGVVDSLMVGRVSPAALAAVALGNLYFWGLSAFGIGVLMALDPVVAQAVGARDEPAVTRAVQRGMLLAVGLSVPSSLLFLTAEPILALLGQPADVVPVAGGYAVRVMPAVFPFYAFLVLRQSLQAMKRMRPIVVAIILANLLNVALNWVLVFGKLGFPAMGAFGSAWATSASRWLMALGLLALAWPQLGPYLTRIRGDVVRPRPLARMLALGSPIGIQFQLEFGAFGVIALLMGRLGTAAVAAHQVAINLASLTFMVPLGISAAAAVLVGHGVGRGDAPEARSAARAALTWGAGFMALMAVLFLALPGELVGLYTPDREVLALGSALVSLAGLFQVFDGIQVVSAGILRGTGETRPPMLINVLGFWLVGIPVSLALAFGAGLGPRGLWWGLVAGLAAVAGLLLLRVRVRLGERLERVVIDEIGEERQAVGRGSEGRG